MQLNLIIGIVWLVAGVALLILQLLDPTSPWIFAIRGTNISAGWLGIFLAIYNFVRWYNLRSSATDRDMLISDWQRRQREERRERRLDPPDPNFDFTDQIEKQSIVPEPTRESLVASSKTTEPVDSHQKDKKKWNKMGANIGFLAGLIVGLVIAQPHLKENAAESIGSTLFIAFVSAILGGVLGALLSKISQKV
jgi:hypothetical protein